MNYCRSVKLFYLSTKKHLSELPNSSLLSTKNNTGIKNELLQKHQLANLFYLSTKKHLSELQNSCLLSTKKTLPFLIFLAKYFILSDKKAIFAKK